MSEQDHHWYAVYTRPRWEKKIAQKLEAKGYEAYCPLNRVVRQWSDRKKTVHEPLFKGYVFVQVAEEDKWKIREIDGILNYVYWNGKPGVIQHSEIETIKRFLNQFTDVTVTEYKLALETRVKIKAGILMNYEGTVVELQGNRAVVKIESMGIQLSAVFEKKNLEPIEEKAERHKGNEATRQQGRTK
ncbi:UpxY family transcription antiterminator [Flavisolibacter sp. BT320]|nr:UpxY family transcription antiterminator [Flavisolibacter longurius]